MAEICLVVGVDAFHDIGSGLVAEAAIVAATICYAAPRLSAAVLQASTRWRPLRIRCWRGPRP
jgi:hypothetical protein